MRILIITLVCVLAASLPAFAGLEEAGWMTDFKTASELALEKKTPILVAFVNSQHRGWYQKLEEDLLMSAPFAAFAEESLILVLADYPENGQQSADILEQNKDLIQRYDIKWFPTLLLLDSSGKEIGQTRYQEGGPEAFVAHLKSILENPDKHRGK
jgi:protein disulfide-isomerase